MFQAIGVIMDTVSVRFPGKSCCLCGEELPVRSTACVHPSMRGPKGGKMFCHEACLSGAHSNPFGGHNPFMATNAGRRTFKGQPKSGRLPRFPPGDIVMMHKTIDELVDLAGEGDSGAIGELARRARRVDGTKAAWGEKAMSFKSYKASAAARKATGSGFTTAADSARRAGKAANNPGHMMGKWSDRYTMSGLDDLGFDELD